MAMSDGQRRGEDREAMKLTVASITARKSPRYEWLVAGLAAQVQPSDEIELVIVDFYGRGYDELVTVERSMVPWLKNARVAAPKPTIYQGQHRVTSRDLCAMSNARNTAICLAQYDYIAFLDDGCLLGPDWLATVREGESARASVLVGPYDMHEEGGRISIDSRSQICHQDKIDCGGGWLYTGNVSMPLEWVLEVNGFEEGCDSMGYEDCLMGIMLANRGRRVDFVKSMQIQQDRRRIIEAGRHPFPRIYKGESPNDKSHAMWGRFGGRTRTEFTPDLTQLRVTLQNGGSFPIPDPSADYRDWYDGAPLRDL
jgi:hypothetical protein